MKTIEEFREIAYKLCDGMVDKGGHPYKFHLQAVEGGVEGFKEKVVALFHDSIEDGLISYEELSSIVNDQEIMDNILAMTHKEEESYMEYVERLSHYPLARRVKMSDLTNNMDLSRLKVIREKDIQRVEKYKKAMKFLQEKEKE